jgi:hypothetical protein
MAVAGTYFPVKILDLTQSWFLKPEKLYSPSPFGEAGGFLEGCGNS